MSPDARRLVMETLRVQNPPVEKLAALERLGDEAFDLIADVVRHGSLPPLQHLYAIRRLSLLTRQQCFARTEDVLRLALAAMRADDVRLRSGAMHAAIMLTKILEANPAPIRSPEFKPGVTPSLRETVQEEVERALALGLDHDGAQFAGRFLANEV